MKKYITPHIHIIPIEPESAILAWSREDRYDMQVYGLKQETIHDYSDEVEGSDSYRSNLWGNE